MKTVKVFNMGEWDKLVSETYDLPYNFQQQDGCKARGTHFFSVPEVDEYDFETDTVPEIVNSNEMGVSFDAWLKRDPTQKLNESDPDYRLGMWWERNFYPHVSMVINDLHSKGLLDEGDYMINIDW